VSDGDNLFAVHAPITDKTTRNEIWPSSLYSSNDPSQPSPPHFLVHFLQYVIQSLPAFHLQLGEIHPLLCHCLSHALKVNEILFPLPVDATSFWPLADQTRSLSTRHQLRHVLAVCGNISELSDCLGSQVAPQYG